MFVIESPYVDEIIADSRLRPEQLSRAMTEEEFHGDVLNKIFEQVSVVDVRLASLGTLTESQNKAARLAVKLLTLASLYLTAGQLKPEYMDRSREFQSRGEAILQAIEYIPPPPSVNRAATMTTGRGDYSS